MKQDMLKYTKQDLEIWNYLFENQYSNLTDKVCFEYLECISELSDVLNPHEIPNFNKLNQKLYLKTGWMIEVVPGLIEVDDFFEYLKNKKFCSSTWLRKKDQLHYIEEPDMFHDIFGHIPLFMNQDYADFAQKIGDLAFNWKHDQNKMIQLQRLYWFTIEFGVIRRDNNIKSYGAGIISSIAEAKIVSENKREFLPYDIDTILNREFNIDTIQPIYFVIDSFEQLFESLKEVDFIFRNAA